MKFQEFQLKASFMKSSNHASHHKHLTLSPSPSHCCTRVSFAASSTQKARRNRKSNNSHNFLMKRTRSKGILSVAEATCTTYAMLVLCFTGLPCVTSLAPSIQQTTYRETIAHPMRHNLDSREDVPLTRNKLSKLKLAKHAAARRHYYSSHMMKLQMANFIQLYTDHDQPLDEDSSDNSRWLSWMTGGTPRGVADVKMRDPVELGGVPRSDRYASRDWLHNTINLPKSAILKDVSFPVTFMTIWGTLIAIIYKRLMYTGRKEIASNMCIPTQPHSLMVSALGLLLVFRTNSAYQRFAEGRKIWEEILSITRDLSRLGKLYEPQLGSAKLRRVNRLLAAFPYLLRFRIRPNSIMRKIDDPDVYRDPEYSLILYQDHATSDSDAEAAAVATDEETTGVSRRKPRELYWVDKRTLPWRLLSKQAMEECARAQNRPLWVCDRLAKELHSVPDQDNWSARERLTLLSKVEKLSGCIGACERIHQTVVPLNYARHALRSLTMWLLSLPFALVKDLGFMTGPILFVVSWMLFGVYEIGYSIEDPFQGTLRLSILCDAIRRDVLGDELIRNTAFTLDKEALKADGKEVTSEVKVVEEEDDDDDMEDGDTDNLSVEIEEILIDELGNAIETEHFARVKVNGDVTGTFVYSEVSP